MLCAADILTLVIVALVISSIAVLGIVMIALVAQAERKIERNQRFVLNCLRIIFSSFIIASLLFINRECGVVLLLIASVCPIRAVTCGSLDLETFRLVRRYIFRIFRSSSYITVIGSRSRSQEQEACSRVVCL